MMDEDFLNLLRKDKVIPLKPAAFHLLTGGVSSELYCFDVNGRRFVVKRALKRLQVKADWFADVSRNRYEAEFLRYVGAFLPDSVPEILGQGEGYFVMEFLEDCRDWKRMLTEKIIDPEHARKAGALLGKIHGHSFGGPTAAKLFDSTANFVQLRVSPYFHSIAAKHLAVSEIILEEADRLTQTRECLIHGDYSPKNILISSDRFILVDCEVAFYGDPAFDLGFLLSHLLLKALLHAPETTGLHVLTGAFMAGYQKERALNFRAFTGLEHRVARLLPMFLLARVDGKSPVEYLDKEKQDFTRAFALDHIIKEDLGLKNLIGEWFYTLRNK